MLHTPDVIVLAGYLAGLAVMGIGFARKNNSTEQYFLGGRSFPGWAIGISMVGTSISSVTFLAFPAAAFILDWRLLVPNLMLPLVAVLAILLFIPLFRRGGLTSAFEYLEERFGPMARLYAAASFLLMQLIRLGTVLYLVSLPVGFLVGATSDEAMMLVIVGCGLLVGLYTIVGGIQAVIWTDVVQTFVLVFGGVACLACMVWDLPGGFGQLFSLATEHDKFSLGSTQWNLSERTLWAMVLIGLYNWLTEYSGNQNVVQRYVAASSMREARKATAICAGISIPIWTFFFFLGTCLFVYYTAQPDPKVAGLEADQVFPHFILTRLPTGLSGIVVAGVLAAAMSSLDSSINAIATVSVVDVFKRHLAPGRTDRFYLRVAWAVSAAATVLMIGGAILFFHLPKESMVDLGLILTSVFGGGVMGMFMLGFFTRSVDYLSLMLALGAAILFNIYLALCSLGKLPASVSIDVHEYWIGVLVNVGLIGLGWLIGQIRRGRVRELGGLTVWTMEHSSVNGADSGAAAARGVGHSLES